MSYQLKVEKIIKRPASEVFQGIKEGLLFMNCGMESTSLEIDFCVGGKYKMVSRGHQAKGNNGEFLEIIPNKKVVFTWCQNFGASQKPDTTVSIELFEENGQTKMILEHNGFTSSESRDAHEKGWSSITSDFGRQISDGELRLLAGFEVSPEKLQEICGKEVSFLKPQVRMTVLKKDNGNSSLEIIHSGLREFTDQKINFAHWEVIIKKIRNSLNEKK